MRLERAVTSVSWIPSEAMTGPMRIPMDLGIGHYDPPPPDRIDAETLEELRASDRFRFANRLSVRVEVDQGRIVDAGYTGGGLVGSTTARLGMTVTIPGVAFPVIQEPPAVNGDVARFVQTAGGRTGAPLPRRIDRPPFLRLTAPSAWTTLAVTVTAKGDTDFELVGASPFPRHWVYDSDGRLRLKSGVVDFAEWTRVHDHDRSPWHEFERSVLTAEVESKVERELSRIVMSSRPELIHVDRESDLIVAGEPGEAIYLILDGMLTVVVGDEVVAELGPGAIVGERAVLEGGRATATVTASTPVRAARIPAEAVDSDRLEKVAEGHRREERLRPSE